MIKNYFKIAWRNIIRHKAYSAINIAGLAIGIADSLLIFVVVTFELSYDRFQKNYDRICRAVTFTNHGDGSSDENPGIPHPGYDAIKSDFPQFEKVVAVAASSGTLFTVLGTNPNNDVSKSEKFIEESNIIFTQPDYFDVFNTTWLAGQSSVLTDAGNAVISESLATKYFGDWKKAMGQYLKLENSVTVRVAGIVADNPPNSDFPIKFFGSYETYKKYPDIFGYSPEWGSLSSNHEVYVVLPKNTTPANFSRQLKTFSDKYYKNEGPNNRQQILQPLSIMHFDQRYGTLGDHISSKSILWTLSLIALLIIVMASINFINLSTAQAAGRSKEIGIRKVLGSQRKQLVAQSMGETFLIVAISIGLSILIAIAAMPFLSNVASIPAHTPLLTRQTIGFLLAGLIGISVLAGLYPALLVSGFKPALALKNKITSASIGGISLRRVLVVTQFAISQVLIIGTIVAVGQMNHVRNADLGFNKEAVMVLPSISLPEALARINPLKQQLLQNPNIISVSFASDEATSDNNWASNFAFDNKKDEDYPVFHKYGDEDYVKTYGLKLIAGRNYEASDTMRELLINETLTKKLGLKDPALAVGKNIRVGGGKWLPVVGVVKDFKTNSLKDDVKPLTIAPRKDFYYTIALKLRTGNLPATTAAVEKLWKQTYPEYAYRSHFVDDTIEQFYRQETQLTLLYKIFAGIAIFISCLGLYGLVSFMAVQKTKEVGVRKVLGASVGNIVLLFSKEFTLLITIAFVIAVPVAWYFMSSWLQNFQERIQIGIGIFVLAILSSLIIAWATVGYRAVRAALANPVKSLRSE